MEFLNIGFGEILFIAILALIIFGPNNMVKTARDAGALIRKVTKSPYWKEVWATKKELDELPRMLAREANLNETIRDFQRESRETTSFVADTVSDLIKEVNQPLSAPPDASGPATGEVKESTPPVESQFRP